MKMGRNREGGRKNEKERRNGERGKDRQRDRIEKLWRVKTMRKRKRKRDRQRSELRRAILRPLTFSSSNFRSTCSSLFRFRSFLIPFPLSLSFSPLVSRSCLPFSCGFFLSLRRERGRGRGRGESSGPASISRSRTGRLVNRAPTLGSSRPLVLSSTATSLPIQFYGGRSPRIPS